jgi:hypothetical protein
MRPRPMEGECSMGRRHALHMRSSAIVGGIVALAAMVPVLSQGQTINSFNIGQVSWQDPTGAPLAGGTNSRWGALTMNVSPHATSVFYVNMSARFTGSGSAHAWMVRNLPIFPATAQADPNQQVALDLADLIGFTIGVALTNLDVRLSLDATPQPVQPAGTAFNNTVPQGTIRRAQERILNPTNPLAYIGTPSGHKAGGADAVVPTGSIQHKNVPAVQEGNQECLAGSFARSLRWLEQEYDLANLPGTTTGQDIFDTLTGPPHNVSNDTTKTYAQHVAAKHAYFKSLDNRAITKILDLGNNIGPVTDVPEYTGIDLVAFLNSQLPTEDVELHYDTHIVTLTGIYKQGSKTFVKFRDDEAQGDNGLGDGAEKDAELTLVGGKYHFNRADGFSGGEVSVAIVESVVDSPLPGGIPTLGEWGLILLAMLLLGFGSVILVRRQRHAA